MCPTCSLTPPWVKTSDQNNRQHRGPDVRAANLWVCVSSLAILWASFHCHPHSLKRNESYEWTHSFRGLRECISEVLLRTLCVDHCKPNCCTATFSSWLNSYEIISHWLTYISPTNRHPSLLSGSEAWHWNMPRNLKFTLGGRKCVVMITGSQPKALEIVKCLQGTTSGCVVGITYVLTGCYDC